MNLCPRCALRIGFPYCLSCRLALTQMTADTANDAQRASAFRRWLAEPQFRLATKAQKALADHEDPGAEWTVLDMNPSWNPPEE